MILSVYEGRRKVKVKELTVEQLKTLIENAVEERLQEYLGDPDEGLEIKPEVIEKIKAQKAANKPKTTLEQIARRHGIELR
jgi:predicted house-cleaning noncanonical NTP pyrophosphatase (MazG superfamily)